MRVIRANPTPPAAPGSTGPARGRPSPPRNPSPRSARRASRFACSPAPSPQVVLRLAEMRFELGRALERCGGRRPESLPTSSWIVLRPRRASVASRRIAWATLDRHHHERRRDDDHPGAMGLLHQFVEMLDEIGIDRLRKARTSAPRPAFRPAGDSARRYP